MIKKLLKITLSILLLTIAFACGKKEEAKIGVDFDDITVEKINYSVIKTEDSVRRRNDDSVYRRIYTLVVVVDNEANIRELEEVAKKIADESIKNLDSFNAIVMFFTDREEYLEVNNHILGKVTYAPEGEFSNAAKIEPGNYKDMDFKFQFKEKDWSTRPTKEEALIVQAYHKEFNYDEVATGKKYSISKEKVEEIINRYNYWMIQQ